MIRTVAWLALFIAIPYAHPSLARLRLLAPLPPEASLFEGMRQAPPAASVVGETRLVVETTDQAELRQPDRIEPVVTPVPSAARGMQRTSPVPMEDASGRALNGFFDVLGQVERGERGALARISYFGDFIVASDFVTGTLRRRLQSRFGDAGHGFMLMANAWPGYFHNDVVRFAAPGWHVSRVVGPFAQDRLYGLGGVSFRSEGPGVYSRFGTTTSGTFGRRVSRFVFDYLEQPNGVGPR